MINYSATILATPVGGTLALDRSELPTTGYFVGGLVSALIYGAENDPDDVDCFAEYLDHATPAQFIGWWTDQETQALWVDGTSWHEGLTEALVIARDRNEIAIYDIANQKEVRL
jgi:hypothetical protein